MVAKMAVFMSTTDEWLSFIAFSIHQSCAVRNQVRTSALPNGSEPQSRCAGARAKHPPKNRFGRVVCGTGRWNYRTSEPSNINKHVDKKNFISCFISVLNDVKTVLKKSLFVEVTSVMKQILMAYLGCVIETTYYIHNLLALYGSRNTCLLLSLFSFFLAPSRKQSQQIHSVLT